MKKLLIILILSICLIIPSIAISDGITFPPGSIGAGGALTDLNGYLNGMSIEKQSLTVVVSGTSVYLDIESTDAGDINYWIDGVKYTLDCTTGSGVGGKARVELDQGTAINPKVSLVYAAYSEQLDALTLLTTPPESIPNGYYASVALITIQDYSSVSANGALLLQRTTETVSHSGKSAISWEREKIRALGAKCWSGIDQDLDITVNGASEDNINFFTSSGIVFQLHRQQLSNVDISSDGIQVANASGDGTLTNYQILTDLNSLHEISDGTALSSGDSVNIVIWGSVNYGGENKLFVNLPTAKYTVDADAVNDTNNTAVRSIPVQFRTTGYLIAQLVLKYTSTNGGTWSNLLTSTVSTWHTGWQYWDTTNYPSNYNNNESLYLTTTITESGATAIRMVFDEFNTEANYDFIRLRNVGGTNIFSYSGNLGSFTSANISGDTVRVWFNSDGSVTRSGVRSNKYEYQTTEAAGSELKDLRGVAPSFAFSN